MTIDPKLGPNAGLIGVPGSRERLETPALVLDLDALEHNIAGLASHAASHGYKLRPVAKVHKSVEIARRQMAAGAIGQCCATLAEAEIMAAAGIQGVFLFSSVATPGKIARLVRLAAAHPDFLLAVDDAGNAEAIGDAARAAGATVRLLVDIEIGGGRTGLVDLDAAVALAEKIARHGSLAYAGLQGYDGSLQSKPSFAERSALQAKRAELVSRAVERLKRAGLPPEIVTGGGTGSHAIDVAQGVFTEVQAGSYVFLDVNYADTDMRADEPRPFRPSLFVRTTVISAAQPGFVVTDAGVKEFARDGLASPRPARGAPAGASYRIVGDDMGRLDFAQPGDRLKVGDAIECLTPHCYATLNLYSIYHCVRGDTLVDIWPIDARATW
ncbi:MAG: DSD1 family PLP-dependent enzyme [Alphaproteobacteria bacterium]